MTRRTRRRSGGLACARRRRGTGGADRRAERRDRGDPLAPGQRPRRRPRPPAGAACRLPCHPCRPARRPAALSRLASTSVAATSFCSSSPELLDGAASRAAPRRRARRPPARMPRRSRHPSGPFVSLPSDWSLPSVGSDRHHGAPYHRTVHRRRWHVARPHRSRRVRGCDRPIRRRRGRRRPDRRGLPVGHPRDQRERLVRARAAVRPDGRAGASSRPRSAAR